MGAMKKFFITCILVGSTVPFFQNCGQQAFNGNGDPYEIGGDHLDIGGGYSSELPSSGMAQPGTLERTCVGGGLVKRVDIYLISGAEMIYFTTSDNKTRSIKNTVIGKMAYSLNVVFDSKITIKTLNVFSSSVTVGVEKSLVLNNEQMSCTVH